MFNFKYALMFSFLLGITFSIQNNDVTLCAFMSLSACDIEDYDDDFDYDDYDSFDYWVDDEHAGNAQGYWDIADSFVCTPDIPSNNNNDQEEDEEEQWWVDDYDPCENGDCEDDTSTDTETNNNTKDCAGVRDGEAYIDECGQCVGGTTGEKACVKDCAGVRDGEAYIDECGQCVGGTTGKKACVKDCMGVENGKAYTIECNGLTICRNGNAGIYDLNLNEEDSIQFNEAITQMRNNCFANTLLENLNENYGIEISMSASQGSNIGGSFNPCDYTIKFTEEINADNLIAELFHAYQEQISNGKLSEIASSTDHMGGSNIEAEEKVVGFIYSSWYGYAIENENCKLSMWAKSFMENHIKTHSCGLSEEELKAWHEAVKDFAEYSRQQDQETGTKTLYGTPVDDSLHPDALTNLCYNLSEECNPQEITITP